MPKINGVIKNAEFMRWQKEGSSLPELPEVETIYRQIVNELDLINELNHSGGSSTNWSISIDSYLSLGLIPKRAPLIRTQRKGKNIVLYCLSFRIHIHLGMTGRIHILKNTAIDSSSLTSIYSHTKMIIQCHHDTYATRSFRLVFTDTRGFGRYSVERWNNPLLNILEIKELGIDPTYPAEFTKDSFTKAILRYPNQAIGTVLLNQRLIAGIGNIYRSEILHAACIHPARSASSLNPVEIENMYVCTTEVIMKAITMGGTSIHDHRSSYRDLYGNRGLMANCLQVYQRDGLTCYNCGRAYIQSIDLEKLRRVYFCPNCQVNNKVDVLTKDVAVEV